MIDFVHHSLIHASSTVVGPWNEESLWNRAGELGMGDVKSHRLDRFMNSSHGSGRVFLHPQCANLLVYIRTVPCPLNYCCCCRCRFAVIFASVFAVVVADSGAVVVDVFVAVVLVAIIVDVCSNEMIQTQSSQ